MKLQLEGRRALVTGSTDGIGAEIARTLAAEGAVVAINGRNEERANRVAQEIREAGGQAALALADLSREGAAEALAKSAVEQLGGVDILVNNVGGRTSTEGASDWFGVGPETWLTTYAKNVVAPVRLIHALTPAMVERGWGRVIQVASIVATKPPSALGDYSASKAGSINMTLGLSKALARTGVTVNAVSPGMIQTDSINHWLDQIGAEQGWGADRQRSEAFALKNFVDQTVRRIGRVEDVANMVAYIASPLSDFINGVNIHVDGGQSSSLT